MDEPTMNSLVQRLEQLERGNHHLKLILVLVLVVSAALLVMGQTKYGKVTKVIEAEQFVLQDAPGRVRAVLGVIENGGAVLSFMNKDGKMVLGVGVTAKDAPSVELYPDGKRRAALQALSADGPVNLEFTNKQGTAVLGIGVTPNGTPGLSLYGPDWKARAVLQIPNDEDSKFAYVDRYGCIQAELKPPKGQPVMCFFNDSGKLVWSAP